MGTRTNFYKNPSYAYNKQFNLNSVLQNLHTYNVATGTADSYGSDEPAPIVNKKRRLESPPDRLNEIKEDVVSMSHQEYIDKRRKEADSSQPYQELTVDILESSSSALNLVGYESDDRASTECEEEDPCSSRNFDSRVHSSNAPISDNIAGADQVKTRNEQRYPTPGEPVCVVCRKYGEYICSETNDDICSIECKSELLQRVEFQQEPHSVQPLVTPFFAHRCTLEVPESGGDTWDYDRHCWSKKTFGLCSYECWKCHKPGHLAEDCLVLPSQCEFDTVGATHNNVVMVQNKSTAISRNLLDLYKRCHHIGKKFLAAKCNLCRGTTTLATCLCCDNTFCDCAGHLSEHIIQHPRHQKYYSYKLKRLVFIT